MDAVSRKAMQHLWEEKKYYGMPSDLIFSLEQQIKDVEIESIDQIYDNYIKYSTIEMFPFKVCWWWLKQHFPSNFIKKEDPYSREIREYQGWLPHSTFRILEIDDIHVDVNSPFKEMDDLLIANLKIYDSYNSIQGTYIFKEDSDKEKDLIKVLELSSASHFDIRATALPRRYNGKILKEKLLVHSIKYNGEYDKEIEYTVPDFSSTINEHHDSTKSYE